MRAGCVGTVFFSCAFLMGACGREVQKDRARETGLLDSRSEVRAIVATGMVPPSRTRVENEAVDQNLTDQSVAHRLDSMELRANDNIGQIIHISHRIPEGVVLSGQELNELQSLVLDSVDRLMAMRLGLEQSRADLTEEERAERRAEIDRVSGVLAQMTADLSLQLQLVDVSIRD